MEPASEDTRTTLAPLERELDLTRAWTMKGGAMEEVVYILTSSSQFGPSSKDSRMNTPAVMITIDIGVPESCEARSAPHVGFIRSMLVSQWRLGAEGEDGAEFDLLVAKTSVDG